VHIVIKLPDAQGRVATLGVGERADESNNRGGGWQGGLVLQPGTLGLADILANSTVRSMVSLPTGTVAAVRRGRARSAITAALRRHSRTGTADHHAIGARGWTSGCVK
jgi:hypothetical protein